MLNPIADTESISTGSSSAWVELFARDNCAPRSKMRCKELNAVLIHSLYFERASITAAVFCSLIVAGLLKGIIGVGMPIVALPLLSLFIDIKSAVMLLSMPLIF